MNRPLKFYINHPITGLGLFIKLMYDNFMKNRIPETLNQDLENINAYVKNYKTDDHYDFEGIRMTASGFNPDLFFNVVYPHLEKTSYTKSDINRLYKTAKKRWKSVDFYADNRLFMVNKNSIIAHGAPYFFEDCIVEKNDVVMDLGASPGDFAALAIRHGAQKVYCFDSGNTSDLRHTAQLNNDKIEIISQLVSNETVAGSKIKLDDLVDDLSINNIDFIKMDIEGHEPQALLGAEILIRKFKPKMAICVYHELFHLKAIKSYLNSLQVNYNFCTLGPVLYCIPK